MKTITLTNSIHNTSVTLRVAGDTLTASQVRRARKALCGMRDCCCGEFNRDPLYWVSVRADGSATFDTRN